MKILILAIVATAFAAPGLHAQEAGETDPERSLMYLVRTGYALSNMTNTPAFNITGSGLLEEGRNGPSLGIGLVYTPVDSELGVQAEASFTVKGSAARLCFGKPSAGSFRCTEEEWSRFYGEIPVLVRWQPDRLAFRQIRPYGGAGAFVGLGVNIGAGAPEDIISMDYGPTFMVGAEYPVDLEIPGLEQFGSTRGVFAEARWEHGLVETSSFLSALEVEDAPGHANRSLILSIGGTFFFGDD